MLRPHDPPLSEGLIAARPVVLAGIVNRLIRQTSVPLAHHNDQIRVLRRQNGVKPSPAQERRLDILLRRFDSPVDRRSKNLHAGR